MAGFGAGAVGTGAGAPYIPAYMYGGTNMEGRAGVGPRGGAAAGFPRGGGATNLPSASRGLATEAGGCSGDTALLPLVSSSFSDTGEYGVSVDVAKLSFKTGAGVGASCGVAYGDSGTSATTSDNFLGVRYVGDVTVSPSASEPSKMSAKRSSSWLIPRGRENHAAMVTPGFWA